MSESLNPLSEKYDVEYDRQLVSLSLHGDRKALNQLLESHNAFIYNIALKMIGDVEKAKDLTQDILIKITTNLSKYDAGRGQFRSWLYRLAFNHILDHKKSPTEQKIKSFSQFFDVIESIPDQTSESDLQKQDPLYSDEVKIKCTAGMLMCLSREQRLLYIVGEVFQVDHNLGAEIFDVSKENFRKKLSRIRQELHQWMHNKCGLINKDNPCQCKKKTRGFIEKGIVDPKALIWDHGFKHRIEEFSKTNLDDLQVTTDSLYAKLYREHPLKEPQSADEVLSTVLGDKNIAQFLNL